MQGTVDGFSYGFVTPLAAFLMACLGGALGLRCTTKALCEHGAPRLGWLALGATAIGSGIWTMHFIAMLGFTVRETPIGYDPAITFAGLAVAIVMVGIGIFIVGHRGATAMALVTGGTITGLGIATTHYLGMAGMRLPGTLQYDTPTIALSVVIAVVAATSALWAAVSLHGFLPSLGGSIGMGTAVTGMHYTGMAAVRVHLHGDGATTGAGEAASPLLVPMLVGPAVFLLLAGLMVMIDPLLVAGDGERRRLAAPRRPGAPIPWQSHSHGDPATRPSFRGPRRREHTHGR
ncbi:MHYT domain-containing protein [Streptomyces gobitricini]|uniref:MHYT domain-containing protein n=1 Tax=Streptomyces gobitricini TaxID=68211 RepID=A0ABP6AAP4_9ACTN